MRYYFRIATSLSFSGSKVLYDESVFFGDPILASVPSLARSLVRFANSLDKAVLVEARSPEPQVSISDDKSRSGYLGLLSGEAYIVKVSELKGDRLDRLSKALSDFVRTEDMQYDDIGVSPNVFDPSWSPYFSGLSEVSAIRNMVSRLIASKNKAFRKSYLFLMLDTSRAT